MCRTKENEGIFDIGSPAGKLDTRRFKHRDFLARHHRRQQNSSANYLNTHHNHYCVAKDGVDEVHDDGVEAGADASVSVSADASLSAGVSAKTNVVSENENDKMFPLHQVPCFQNGKR